MINFEEVHNYFERLVFDEVVRRSGAYPGFTPDMFTDVACVALNRLPPRYVVHDVDMLFYLAAPERDSIEKSVDDAVTFAFARVGGSVAVHPSSK